MSPRKSALWLALILALSAQAPAQTPPVVLSLAASNITENSAVLGASFNRKSTKRVAGWFKWGTTTNLPNRTPTQFFSGGTNLVVLSRALGGLATNRTYYYRVFASNEFGVRNSGIYNFTTKHDVRFGELSASNITADGAMLTANFTAKHSGLTWFRYGFSSNVGYSTPVASFTAANSNLLTRSQQLTNLTPNRTYYYRLMASNQFGVSGSAFSNFTTRLNFALGPVEVTLYPQYSATLAVLSSTVTPPWGVVAWFEWGTNTNNVSMTGPWEASWTPETVRHRLQPNTLYYCRLVATNQYGSDSTPWTTFRTPTGLIVTTHPAGSGNTYPPGPGYPLGIGAIGSTTARLGGRIDNVLPLLTDAWFEWGTTTNYGNRTPIAVSGFGGFDAFAVIDGLQEAGVIYHYRVVASNSVGMEFGQNVSFATPLFPVAVMASVLPGVVDGRMMSGDFDNDGRLDIVLAGHSATGAITQVWLRRGEGYLRMQTDFPGLSRVALSGGDHDNDGRLDILLGAAPIQEFRIWGNSGPGFSTLFSGPLSAYGYACNLPVWGDHDNDGRIDIAAQSWHGLEVGDVMNVWHNTREGMDVLPLRSSSLRAAAGAWADYDNDGWLDIVVKGDGSHVVTEIWRNRVSGFSNVFEAIPGTSGGSIDWGDFDNDGRLDLALAGILQNGQAVCEVWRNTPTGFSNVNAQLPPLGDDRMGASAKWGDYDNDGRLDLLLYGYDPFPIPRRDPIFTCDIWRNTGNGFTNIGAGLPNLMHGSAGWGDYDHDGRLDVLLTGESTWLGLPPTQIYRNLLVPPNSPPTAPTGLQVFRTSFGVAFTWLAATDAQTPNSGLSYNIRVGSAPGQCDLVSPNALPDGRRLLLQLGNAQMRRFAYLTGLTNGQTVYWTVQAIDTAFAGGPFAPEQSFVHPPSATWVAPSLTITRTASTETAKLAFTSSLPLPFSIFNSTNLSDWEQLATPTESAPGVFDITVPITGRAHFYQLRSP